MRNLFLVGTIAGSLMLAGGAALAADKSDYCIKAGVPERIDGEITMIDANNGKITLRSADGGTHEFQASKETLAAYKVGDPIKIKLRPARRCD